MIKREGVNINEICIFWETKLLSKQFKLMFQDLDRLSYSNRSTLLTSVIRVSYDHKIRYLHHFEKCLNFVVGMAPY